MTYLKDLKLCVDCQFFDTPDKCLHKLSAYIEPVHGSTRFMYAMTMRGDPDLCGREATHFIHASDAHAERVKRAAEMEEAMRDSPI
jgi:hypothetical protein